MINCLIEGMKKLTVKPVNYEKVKEVQQGQDENLAVFPRKLVEAFRKYTNWIPPHLRARPFWLCISQPSLPQKKDTKFRRQVLVLNTNE